MFTMIMADVFKILFLILGSLVTLVCYWLFFQALLPAAVDRARQAYECKPFRTTLLGVAAGIPLVVLGLALASAQAAPVKLAGVSLLVALMLAALLGSTGLISLVGRRLPSSNDRHQPWRATLRGGCIVSVTFVLPIAGWFAVLPWALISGFGAALVAWHGRPKTKEQTADARLETANA